MPRKVERYTVGEYWLDKRRDGKSPDIWQIASYNPATRSISYRSTRTDSLDDAKGIIKAFAAAEHSKQPQRPEDAKVIPLLYTYWEEHGRKVVSPAQIASSIRQFVGFLMQDRVGMNATVSDLTPTVFTRFLEWRMSPHTYAVPWGGHTLKQSSKGVRGESVQRNLDDVRAALTHHANNGRLPYVPKVPSVPATLRSPPKDRVLSNAELGAIIGYAMYDPDLFRQVALILGTIVRTEAAAKFDPRAQFDQERNLIDLHPVGHPRTKKRNPVVPAIEPLRPILKAWAVDPKAKRSKSHKTRWRQMRRVLGLSDDVELKTMRHTVATRLRSKRVSFEQVETLLGHRVYKKTSEVYAKYDPDYLSEAAEGLEAIWAEVMAAAWTWSAGHLRAKVGNGPTEILDRNSEKAKAFLASRLGGR